MENENQTQLISSSESLMAMDRAQIDGQIATAKQYPRDTKASIKKVVDIATMDAETAESCFYALRRQGTVIEGPSARLAEIIAGAWGNLRVSSQIVANDGKTVTARGICQDLESNFAVSTEVKRRITDKYGKTFSEDMQVVTGNAASSIAMRNAILKVVPKAVMKKAMDQIKDVAIGKALDVETSRRNCLVNFAKLGVTEQMVLDYFEVKSVEFIDRDMIWELKGLWNALKEGSTTKEECFIKPVAERKQAEDAKKKAEEARARTEAMKKRQSNTAGAKEVAIEVKDVEPVKESEDIPETLM